MYNIEDWWRHNGIHDRFQASGIEMCNDGCEYLRKTDDWWESLSDDERVKVFEDFFAEY